MPAAAELPAKCVRQLTDTIVDEDAPLVARAKAGELEAFEELVRRHERALFAYLYRMCGRAQDAEELAHVAFVRAWKGLGRFRSRAKFRTWLFRIGTNLCINRITRRKPLVELDESLPAPEKTEPGEVYRRKRSDELVRAAIANLALDQRSALVLSVYEEMNYQEIAEAMGKSVRAVDSLLVRAKRNIRKLLEPARRKGLL